MAISLVAGLLSAILIAPTPVASAAGKPESISVAYCADCVQFHFQDKDGKADGLIIDMWRLWSERTGIAVEFKAATWEETLRMVGDGRADAHAGLFFNEERARFLEYGTSLTKTDTQFFVHKDLPGIEKVEDLTAYKVGVLSGDYVEGFLKKKLPPENIVAFESYEAIMEALREGRLQVFAADTPTGIFHLQKVGLGYVFEAPASKPLYTQKWFVAATKGNTELIKVINAGMALVSESERQEIERRWASISNPIVFDAEKTDKRLNLSVQERQWLADHPAIRVHNETDWPPFNFFEDGKPQGYSIDYMNLLASIIGVKVEYVTGPTWDEFMSMIKGGDLDVMLNIVKTPERQKYLLYTKPYAFNPNAILSRRGAIYDSLEQLAGKTVAMPKGFFHVEILKRDYPRIKRHLVKNVVESMKAVTFGKADAAIGELAVFNYLLGREMMTGLVLSGEMIGGVNYTQLNIATRKDQPLLISILRKAMNVVAPEEIKALRQRWINVAITAVPKAVKLKLTDAEKAWLAEHKTMRLGVDPAYPPFDFVTEDGIYSGMASEYARIMGERLGVTLEVVPGLSWSQVIEGVKSGAVDVLPAVTRTPERDEFMNFSREHLNFPDVIFMRGDHDLVAGLPDMKGRKVALVKGYATTRHIETNFPSIGRLVVESPLLGLEAVAQGKAEATVQNLGVATYLIKKHDLTDLVVAAPIDLNMPGLSFGVRKDWPELVPIIDKVLASIKPEVEAAIREKWGSTQYQIGIDIATVRQVALQAGGVGAVIFIVIMFWNRRLSREVKQRKQAEDALSLAKVEAEDANRAKSEFLSSMSHELRTPLNAIIGYSEFVSEDQDDPLNEEQMECIGKVMKAGHHLLKLIDEILDLSKIETGAVTLSMQPVDVPAIVDECIELNSSFASDHGIAVEDLVSGANLPPIRVDRTRFKQVLLNFLSNAVKYNRDNGSVTVEQERPSARLIRVNVTDTGGGIAEDHLDDIFKPFDRLGAEASDIQGSGIGLTITKRLVEQMGGEIGVESTLGKGSTFWVAFPVAEEALETVEEG